MISTRITKVLKGFSLYKDSLNITITVNLGGSSISIPNVAIKILLALGALSLVYHAKDLVRLSYSLINSVKCEISHIFKKKVINGTAVIYGATSKMGRAFALKFAITGVSLILIDFSLDKLNKLKIELIEVNKAMQESITCCVLGEGINIKDIHNISQTLKQQKQITYFVNCRNLKESSISQFHTQKLSNILFISHYNIIVYIILLKRVLKLMCMNHYGNIICLNSTYKNEEILKKSHSLFFASSLFVLMLTRFMGLTYKEINFLQLNVNYENITRTSKYFDIAEYSLNKLGLHNDIYF